MADEPVLTRPRPNAGSARARARDLLTMAADNAERVGDTSAPFLRGLVVRCDIEDERDERVEHMLDRAETVAGGLIGRELARQLPGALDRIALRRFFGWIAAGGAVVLAAIAGAYFGGHYLGREEGRKQAHDMVVEVQGSLNTGLQGLTAHQAYTWARLIKFNQDVDLFRRECTRDDIKGHGRQYCTYTLWDEPPPPPTIDQPGK